MRALFFEWPDDHAIWDFPYQYMLGDDLLVAPVVTPGVESWDVYLPAGQWVDAWRGSQFDGPARVCVPAPLDEIPVFVRASAPASLRELFGRVPPTE
jgi:alpha-glucosidase (family GH31 glycosyl hydrolase)